MCSGHLYGTHTLFRPGNAAPHLPAPIRLDARQLRQTQSKKEFELGLSGELRTGPGIASAYRKTGRPLQGRPV